MLSLFWIVVTALLWGVTDPLLKRFGEGIASDSVFNLTTNSWRYALAFLANQVWSPSRHLLTFISLFILCPCLLIFYLDYLEILIIFGNGKENQKQTEWPTQIIPTLQTSAEV